MELWLGFLIASQSLECIYKVRITRGREVLNKTKIMFLIEKTAQGFQI